MVVSWLVFVFMCEIYANSAVSQGEQYKHTYWKNWTFIFKYSVNSGC